MPVGGNEAGDNTAFTSSYGQGKEAVSTNLEKFHLNRMDYFFYYEDGQMLVWVIQGGGKVSAGPEFNCEGAGQVAAADLAGAGCWSK